MRDRLPPAANPFALRRIDWGIVSQLALVAGAGLNVLAPPSEGPMLLAPVIPGDPAATIRTATDAGAAIIGMGPYPGAVFVWGSRDALVRHALPHGMLLLPGSVFGCSVEKDPA